MWCIGTCVALVYVVSAIVLVVAYRESKEMNFPE